RRGAGRGRRGPGELSTGPHQIPPAGLASDRSRRGPRAIPTYRGTAPGLRKPRDPPRMPEERFRAGAGAHPDQRLSIALYKHPVDRPAGVVEPVSPAIQDRAGAQDRATFPDAESADREDLPPPAGMEA